VKRFLFCLAMFSSSVFAQNVNNYLPGAGERIPESASGPGIVYTQQVVGKVISVGSPVYKNVPVVQQCANGSVCGVAFDNQLIGYSFVVAYKHLQMQGFMTRLPQIGEDSIIIVRSIYYPTN